MRLAWFAGRSLSPRAAAILKWLSGILATVIAGIIVWLITTWIIDILDNGHKLIRIDEPVPPCREGFVTGVTDYLKSNHYLVVTAPNGDHFVEDGPLTISPNRKWIGHIRLGTAAAGIGKTFVIRAVATKSTLPLGPLSNDLLADAISSPPVRVTRKDC